MAPYSCSLQRQQQHEMFKSSSSFKPLLLHHELCLVLFALDVVADAAICPTATGFAVLDTSGKLLEIVAADVELIATGGSLLDVEQAVVVVVVVVVGDCVKANAVVGFKVEDDEDGDGICVGVCCWAI